MIDDMDNESMTDLYMYFVYIMIAESFWTRVSTHLNSNFWILPPLEMGSRYITVLRYRLN